MKNKLCQALLFLFVFIYILFSPPSLAQAFGSAYDTAEAYDYYDYNYGNEDLEDFYYPDYYPDYYETENSVNTSLSPLWILGSIAFGVFVGWTVTGSMKARLTSVTSQNEASDYIKQGSMKLTDKNDMFLYRHVSTTPRATTNLRGKRHGGGPGFGAGGSMRSFTRTPGPGRRRY